jgi:starch phosphorylase
VLEQISSGVFSPSEPGLYREFVDSLLDHDHFLALWDFAAYFDTHRAVGRRWDDQQGWWRSAILNTAHMGWFSSDRTIRGYAQDIWNVPVLKT